MLQGLVIIFLKIKAPCLTAYPVDRLSLTGGKN